MGWAGVAQRILKGKCRNKTSRIHTCRLGLGDLEAGDLETCTWRLEERMLRKVSGLSHLWRLGNEDLGAGDLELDLRLGHQAAMRSLSQAMVAT